MRVSAKARVVLVTGVSSGIGQATVTLLSIRGFQVFGTVRKPGEAVVGLPAGVTVFRLGVRDDESVRSA